MGFLKKLFGRKDQIEAFPENESDSEKFDWFRKTPPWDKIDERIITAIITKYKGNPILVAFVFISTQYNLVPNYLKLNDSKFIDSIDMICTIISQTTYNVGSNSLKQMISLADNLPKNQEMFKIHYQTVIFSLESCVILDDNQVGAYAGLAMANSIVNKPQNVLKYAKQGLAVIQRIRESDPQFHMSKHENIRNTMQTFKEIENQLNQLIVESKGA